MDWLEEVIRGKGQEGIIIYKDLAAEIRKWIKEIGKKYIKEQERYFGMKAGRKVCWLCYKEDYCEHKIKIEAVKELLKRLNL